MSRIRQANANPAPGPFRFEIVNATEPGSGARTGSLYTPRGPVDVPGFLPVATRGAVRLVDWHDLCGIGFDAVLANSYHLMLRPGLEAIEAAGGLHRFMGWGGPILTDSGGFQAMSLGGQAAEEGIRFKSVYDGTEHLLTPEEAIHIQVDMGVDMIVALDECPRLPAPRDRIEDATYRTLGWAGRAVDVFEGHESHLLIGVVQGGVDPDLRLECASRMVEMGFGAYAIGGLSVGESFEDRILALEATLEVLPADRPRYLMGVGDPLTTVEAVWRGVDLFDSVLPTRLGRHGSALTWEGRVNLRAAALQAADAPIDPQCSCPACSLYSRRYIRHLLVVGEETGRRLVSIHNLHFVRALFAAMREAIREGTLGALREKITTLKSGCR